jgi:hypothetical protein
MWVVPLTVGAGREYRAPEVMIAAPYGLPMDIWSAACAFFEVELLCLPLIALSNCCDEFGSCSWWCCVVEKLSATHVLPFTIQVATGQVLFMPDKVVVLCWCCVVLCCVVLCCVVCSGLVFTFLQSRVSQVCDTRKALMGAQSWSLSRARSSSSSLSPSLSTAQHSTAQCPSDPDKQTRRLVC